MQPLPDDSNKENQSEEATKRSPIQHSKRSKISGSEKRVFVEFFIPPPPPLPGDEESSDSYSDSQEEGFDITGIGKGTNILDYSEQVIKKLTAKNEPRGKGPTKLTTINMESILNSATRSGSDLIPEPHLRAGKVPAVRRLTAGSLSLHSSAANAKAPMNRPLRAQSMPAPIEGNLDLSTSSSSESEASSSASSMGTPSASEFSTEVMVPTKEPPIKKLSPIEETTPPLESVKEGNASPPSPSPSPSGSSPSGSASSPSPVPSTSSIPIHSPTSTSASSPSSPTFRPSTSPMASDAKNSKDHRTSSLPSSPSRSHSPHPEHTMHMVYSPHSTPPLPDIRPLSTSPQTPKRGFDERVLSPRPDDDEIEKDSEKGEDTRSYHSSRDHSPVVFALELAQAREDASNRTSPLSPKSPMGLMNDEKTKPKEEEKQLTPIPADDVDEEKEQPKDELADEIVNLLSPRQRRMNRLSLSLVNTDFLEVETTRKSRVFDPLMVKHLDTIPVDMMEDTSEFNDDVKGLDLDSELALTDLDEGENESQGTDEDHDQSKRLRRVGRFGKESILKDVEIEKNE